MRTETKISKALNDLKLNRQHTKVCCLLSFRSFRSKAFSLKTESYQKRMQWRIYIEAKEAVLGGHQTQGAPKFIINKKWLRNNNNSERV